MGYAKYKGSLLNIHTYLKTTKNNLYEVPIVFLMWIKCITSNLHQVHVKFSVVNKVAICSKIIIQK